MRLCVCARSWTRGAARVGRSFSLCAQTTENVWRETAWRWEKNDNEQNRGRLDNTPLWVPRPCLPVGRVNVLPRPPLPPQLLLSFPVGRTNRGAVHGPHRYARTHWRLAHASQGRVRRHLPPPAAAAGERTMVVVGLPGSAVRR